MAYIYIVPINYRSNYGLLTRKGIGTGDIRIMWTYLTSSYFWKGQDHSPSRLARDHMDLM